MKQCLLLTLFFFCTTLFAQSLEDEDARFYAQTLFDRDVLSEEGLAQLNLEIRNNTLGKRSNILTGNPILSLPPAQPSSIIGFLYRAYHLEFAYRTAKEEVGALAHEFFEKPVPTSLTTEQENALLAEARKRFGAMPGPKVERALGRDVFADDILPPFFMIFARAPSPPDPFTKKRERPEYKPLISPKRSVIGKDILYVVDLLQEVGLSEPGDAKQHLIDSLETQNLAGHYLLVTVGKSVANREMAPERLERNTAYVEKCLSLGLLDQSAAGKLLANKDILKQASKYPFFSAFTRSSAEVDLGLTPKFDTGLPKILTALKKLDPAFENAELSYKFTENNREPTTRHQDGDDVTLTLTVDGRTWNRTYRMSRTRNPNGTPGLRLNREFLDFFTSYLSGTDEPRILFSIMYPAGDDGPEDLKNRGKHTLLLLSDEEAKAIIRHSFYDRIVGPHRYLRASLGY